MTAPMHMDGVSVARAIDARVAAALAGPLIANLADNVADASPAAETIDTSGVVTPATVGYTQADQTALADTVIALGASVDAIQTALNDLVTTVNAILAALEAADIMAGAG